MNNVLGSEKDMVNTSLCVDLLSMRKLLEIVGGERRHSETREAWLWRISIATGLHFRVIKAIFYGEGISFESAYKIKLAAKKNDISIIERLRENRSVLCKVDPEFFAEEIARIDDLVARIANIVDRKN